MPGNTTRVRINSEYTNNMVPIRIFVKIRNFVVIGREVNYASKEKSICTKVGRKVEHS